MGIEKISVLVKTFLRDDYLYETVNTLESNFPEVQMIIVDDGDSTPKKRALYDRLRAAGHQAHITQFDTGFGFKSNVGVRADKREYMLVGSDDFDFRQNFARPGLERMASFLDDEPGYAIAGGDVVGGGHTGFYEFYLHDYGSKIVEEPIHRDQPKQTIHGVVYHDCDLTRNYVLVRSNILGYGPTQVHWDDDVKIGGGEHGAFFLDVQRAGHRVAFLPDSRIAEQTGKPMDVRYHTFRGRARRPQRECFAHRGILQYWTGNGGCDYDATKGVPQ